MKTIIFSLLFVFQIVLADDGMSEKFNKIQMNINNENYILFEDSSLILASRDNDIYLVEISPQAALFIHGEKVQTSQTQKIILKKYYQSMYTTFRTRNRIGGKAVKVGLAGAKLAVKAIGGLVDYVLSGFDDQVMKDYEKKMADESDKIDVQADRIDAMGEKYKKFREANNKIVVEIRDKVPQLDPFRLEIDEDGDDINITD